MARQPYCPSSKDWRGNTRSRTRKRGYSLDDEEFAPGIRCLAAPVYASDGNVAAAIGITASTVRFTKERIPEMAGKVQAAAAELSRLLGYTAPRR